MSKELLELWRFVRSFDLPKPERLCTFLVRIGGIKDTGHDIKQITGGSRGRPGLINNKSGLTLDHAAEVCWEYGYIGGPPTTSDLLDAIDRDLTTEGVYKATDLDLYAQWSEYKMYVHQLDEFGLMHLVSVAQVIRAIGGIEEKQPDHHPLGEIPF